MKVLRPGRPQKGWAAEMECTGSGNGGGGCNALLLIEQDDLFQTSSGHHDGSVEFYTTFKCVECGVLTDLTSDKTPPRRELPTRAQWEAAHAPPTLLVPGSGREHT